MFCYQKSFINPTLPVDEAQFFALVRATQWAENIDKYRETGEASLKRKLPAFIFQAMFDETLSKKGKLGAWRKQSATRLTGLVVMDIDHIASEELKVKCEKFAAADFAQRAQQLGILLIYITPSGHGLKIVFKARVEWGNLIDNQHQMAKLLGVEVDESCKDASRMSFICKESDILYIDKELFTYENKEFAEKFDAEYRAGNSGPSPKPLPIGRGVDTSGVQGNNAPPYREGTGVGLLSFKGRPYSEIIDEWWKRNGGVPQEGERNVKLYQLVQDMVNAVEVVDGEEMQLHMLTFDTELDNTVTVQKGGSWIDKQSLELKAFHNEEDGQAYSNVDSILQDFYVTWNFIYTGTPIALKKKVNEQNFGSGLATRLTCIPLPATNFEMMEREARVDYESDGRLKAWAFKLDRMKGVLPLEKIVDELYDWTARRMMDAKENDSKADEMLLKRCAYHGLNFAAPFIVMRHWDKMKQDCDYWCGTFETDDVDWRLAELIVNIQFACQRHYFGAMAENYFDNKLKDASVNVQRRQKTYECFARLPEEFTNEDVMRCFNLSSEGSARSKTSRLLRDHLIEKVREERGTEKALFRKTGTILL